MKYGTVVFDMDGTLLDTIDDLTDSVNYAMDVCGHPRHTAEEVKTFVGNGAGWLIERALGAPDRAELEKGIAAFKEFYAAKANKTRPYPGIAELVAKLSERGVKVAVVSNKFHAVVPELTRKHFGGHIPVAIGDSPDIRRKPAPDPVLKAVDELCGDLASTVYIGDSEVDVETARNAGIDCVSVTWGFRGEDLLRKSGGRIFARDARELEAILLG